MATVSAVWWNPFTWFTSDQDDAMASAVGNGSSVLGFFEDAPRWALQHANGAESNFTLWTANAKDKKTEIGFILKAGTTSSTQDRFLRDETGTIIQDDQNKDIKLKYESSKCDGQDCYHISLTNAQAVNIDEFIMLGDNSVAIAFQNETKLNYQTPFASWNVSVECEDVPMDDLWIFHQEDKEKWGANGTFEGLKNCITSYESNVPIIENNWKPYIEDPIKRAGSLGDIIQRHELKHYDICSRNFEPYNFTEIQDGENLTIIAYNKSANCTFDYWDSNQGNETIYYLNVSFLSDNFIDPTIEIINITNGVGLENVVCESDDFCHLNISDPNLILYMPFDVDTTSSYDWSEKENDGSIVGDVTWRSAGKFGGDYDFGGTTDYIAVTSSSSIDLTGNATISYWLNSDDITLHQSTLGRGPALHRRYAMDVYTSKARFLYANAEGFGVGDVVTGSTTLSTGTWYMLTGRFNGTGISIFVNGIEDASLDKTTYPSTGAYNLHIGGNAGLDRWFNGKMDEVMIFNRSLSTGEISALYNATYPRFHTTGNQTIENILNPCNQESADVSTLCGGVDSGIYSVDGNWNDGDWSTYTETTSATYYVNYTIPATADVNNSIWVVKDGCGDSGANEPFEIRLTSPAILDNKVQMKVVQGYGGEFGSAISYLFEGTWVQKRSTGNCGLEIQSRYYEEAMNWSMPFLNDSINITIHHANQGTSNLSLSIWNGTGWSIKQNMSNDFAATFNISDSLTVLNLSFKYIAGNTSNQFWSPILLPNISMEFFDAPTGPVDNEYPKFSIYQDDNGTITGGGSGKFNVTMLSTNGSVYVEINGTNYTAKLLGGAGVIYNTTINLAASESPYIYQWVSYGNGTDNNFNASERNRSYSILPIADIINPNLTIISPLNNTNFTINTKDINFSAYDEIGLTNCWYSNDSYDTNFTTSCTANITNIIWAQGLHNVTVWANDTSGNLNHTSTTFYIDSINPNLTILFPANNTNHSINIEINYSVADSGIGLDSCWYSNDSYSANTSLVCGVNITGITWTNATHNVTIWVNDSLGNINWTSVTFNISTPHIDIINPNLTIVFPANNTNWTINDLEINYTYGDETGITNCWYSNDSYSFNTTITCGVNITEITWIEGGHNVSIWVNDTSGNINTTSTTFYIDSINPNLTILFPANNTNHSINIEINYSVADSGIGLDSCWYSNDSYSADTPIVCGVNITGITWIEGWHNVTVWVNDSLNNINKTSVSFKIDTTPPNIQFDTRTPANNSILNQNFIPINITASDVSSSIDTINITVYNSTGALMGYQHAQADYLLFNITGLRPDLYIFNATVNDSVGNTNKTKPRQVRLIKNVAVNNFEVDIDDLILDSSVYQTILNTTINFTKTGHVTFKGVGAVRKFNNAATSTLALRLTINGMVLTDGNVRTVSGLTDRGVFTIPINGTILTAGVNNFTVEAKESGPGAINLSSLEIFGDGDSSNHGREINHTEQEINLAFASASYINIKNFTFNKSIHSDTIIDITHKFKAGAVSKQPSCYLTNNVTGERTPIYDRFLETASDIGSSGISFISSIASSSETWQLWCKSNDASSIDNNISFYAFSTVDSLQNNISHFSNVTVISTSFEGDDNQILSYYNYEVKNSSAIELMATAIIQSNTGAQVGAASPNLIINSSTLPQANCFESYDRSLSNANDIGTIKVYVNCDGINPGELHNFSLWLNVAAGENITLRNASFGGYEIEELDTSTGVVPPFVTITTPINNSNLSNTVDVNATVSDPSGFGYSSNVSLLNQADGFIFRILDDIDKNMNRTNVSFDTTAVSDGNYKIQWIVNNTAGFNLDTHNVTIDNTNPNLTITTPANNTNTTSTGLNINFTSLDLNGISSRWYTIGNDTTVNITLQNGNNVTNVTWGEGMHNVTVYTNDTFGNMNQTSVSFRIDTKPPAMQFTNQTFAEGVGLNHITNGTDAGVGLGIRNQGIKFALNQSTNFTINSTGAIRNATDTKAGVYLIRLSMNDSLDNENSTIIKIDVTAIDGINPSVTALTETPVEPINYSQSTKYEFNATITDTNLATVKIEFNDTNYTITSPTGNVYNFTIANLSAGLYNYTWCAEDSYSNFNCSEAGLYNVTRATPEGVLTSTKTFTYSWDGADTTIGLTETQAGDGDVTYVIIKDGVEVGTSDTEGSAGAFVYILNTTATGSQNYTFNSSMDVETLTITQRTGWTNGTINGTQGNFSMTNGTGALNRFINASINGSCVGNGSISVNGTRFNNGVLPLFNVTNLTVGFYNITFKYFGNTNCTGNNQTYWVNVSTPLDIINPNLTIVFPANNTNWTINDLEINYTYGDETGITNCWYSNDSYSANTTITCGNNITGITWIEGKHNVSISINDTSGNVNTTSVTFRIDTTAPTLTIDSPANNTNSTDTGLDVLYTVSDVGVGVETCWYSNDSYSANTILPNCIDISTIVWTYDNHNVTIWVNDSLGNENHKSVTFNMSVAQAPAIKRAACDLSVIYDNPKLPHTPVLGCPR